MRQERDMPHLLSIASLNYISCLNYDYLQCIFRKVRKNIKEKKTTYMCIKNKRTIYRTLLPELIPL